MCLVTQIIDVNLRRELAIIVIGEVMCVIFVGGKFQYYRTAALHSCLSILFAMHNIYLCGRTMKATSRDEDDMIE